MVDTKKRVPEMFLHWLWANRCWYHPLKTTQGFEVDVVDIGRANPTDGPDFSYVVARINGLLWHGDVEIDWYQSHWYIHNHHTNQHYNRVIIHLVWEDSPSVTTCLLDGGMPFVVSLRPYVSLGIHTLISRFNTQKVLPCADLLEMGKGIQGLIIQMKKMKKEYFFQKINDLSTFYSSYSCIEISWKAMTIIAIFDALGIPHNRRSMSAIARVLLEEKIFEVNIEEITKRAISKKNCPSKEGLKWSNKGMLPYSRPDFSIPKACALAYGLYHLDIHLVQKNNPLDIWGMIASRMDKRYQLGQHRHRVLGLTVFLPSLWLLGKWNCDKALQAKAYQLWKEASISIPDSIKKVWKKTGVPTKIYSHNLAAVYQYHNYCQQHKCMSCGVINHILRSNISSKKKQ